MTGRITKDKKSGTYFITIEVGTKGNRKRKVQKNFKTKRDAKAALDVALAEFQKEVGNDESKEDLSLGEYLDYWLKAYAKSNTSPNTYRGYEQIIRVHLKPELGHIKLQDLTSLQLQDYYVDKLECLSAQTVKHHHRLLSKALNDAVDWEILNKNVVLKAKPPKPIKFRPTFYSKEELDRLLEAAKSSKVYHPIIYTAGHTGARLGELRALQWKDINFKKKRMAITKSAFEDNSGKVHIKDLTKSGKDRTIVIGNMLMNYLQDLYNHYKELKNRLGESFNPNDLVFLNSKGHYLNYRELQKVYKRAIRRAGLKDSRFHDLRHYVESRIMECHLHFSYIY